MNFCGTNLGNTDLNIHNITTTTRFKTAQWSSDSKISIPYKRLYSTRSWRENVWISHTKAIENILSAWLNFETCERLFPMSIRASRHLQRMLKTERYHRLFCTADRLRLRCLVFSPSCYLRVWNPHQLLNPVAVDVMFTFKLCTMSGNKIFQWKTLQIQFFSGNVTSRAARVFFNVVR